MSGKTEVTKEKWMKLIEEQQRTNEKMSEFCARKGVSLSAFYSARSVYGFSDRNGSNGKGKLNPPMKDEGNFLKFAGSTAAHDLNGHIRITLPSGAVIEVSAHNSEGLKMVLDTLEGR